MFRSLRLPVSSLRAVARLVGERRIAQVGGPAADVTTVELCEYTDANQLKVADEYPFNGRSVGSTFRRVR
jgi:hypothetical protein